MSALHAWMDEEAYVYVSGKDYAGSDRTAARDSSVEQVLAAVNAHLDEVDTEREFLRVERAYIWRFETLWVDPEAFDHDHWDDTQWVNVIADYEAQDDKYDALGWVPVLRVQLVDA
ncbi:hypothetical protein SEA_PLATTE_10 [Microbacterium phage Platte]|nr:hypothetical protein SEA_PLATTE_10 [Microbacterium phage Platte]